MKPVSYRDWMLTSGNFKNQIVEYGGKAEWHFHKINKYTAVSLNTTLYYNEILSIKSPILKKICIWTKFSYCPFLGV